VSAIEEFFWRNSGSSGLHHREYSCRDLLCWPRNTLFLQKLALNSPTSYGLLAGIVHLRTKATEFFFFYTIDACIPYSPFLVFHHHRLLCGSYKQVTCFWPSEMYCWQWTVGQEVWLKWEPARMTLLLDHKTFKGYYLNVLFCEAPIFTRIYLSNLWNWMRRIFYVVCEYAIFV
jgi:hypothetical protein